MNNEFSHFITYENNRIHKSSKHFFDDNFLSLESVEYREAFVGYFAFKGNRFENRRIDSFFHLSTSADVNPPLFFEEVFPKKFLILFNEFLNILFMVWVFTALSDFDFDNSFLFISLEVIFKIKVSVFILNSVVKLQRNLILFGLMGHVLYNTSEWCNSASIGYHY